MKSYSLRENPGENRQRVNPSASIWDIHIDEGEARAFVKHTLVAVTGMGTRTLHEGERALCERGDSIDPACGSNRGREPSKYYYNKEASQEGGWNANNQTSLSSIREQNLDLAR